MNVIDTCHSSWRPRGRAFSSRLPKKNNQRNNPGTKGKNLGVFGTRPFAETNDRKCLHWGVTILQVPTPLMTAQCSLFAFWIQHSASPTQWPLTPPPSSLSSSPPRHHSRHHKHHHDQSPVHQFGQPETNLLNQKKTASKEAKRWCCSQSCSLSFNTHKEDKHLGELSF